MGLLIPNGEKTALNDVSESEQAPGNYWALNKNEKSLCHPSCHLWLSALLSLLRNVSYKHEVKTTLLIRQSK